MQTGTETDAPDGLAGIVPGPNRSKPHSGHRIYPYLFRGVPGVRPNVVLSADINYVRVAPGFAYLVAIIDWYSRKVLGWRLSNSIDAAFCVNSLEETMRLHGGPGVFNSDESSQFTNTAFTDVLKREGVRINA